MSYQSENRQPMKTVVIIGRPNVGKSTLFNRLIGSRKALVFDFPGVTRDRIEEETVVTSSEGHLNIRLVDTGGVGGKLFQKEIEFQVAQAMEEADLVLLMADVRAGVQTEDMELVSKLRDGLAKVDMPVIVLANKADIDTLEEDIFDFYQFGFEEIIPISAEHGRGMNVLKEKIIRILGVGESVLEKQNQMRAEKQNKLENTEAVTDPVDKYAVPKIVFVGKPNVGKSTLLNSIAGFNRSVTSDIAGTTIDSIDLDVMIGKRPFTIIDTAGVRKKAKTQQGIEVLSVVQTRKALDRADVALLMIDGLTGFGDQDEKIGGLIEEAGSSVIIVVNKWDLQMKNEQFSQKEAERQIRAEMKYLSYAPIVFISALEKRGLRQLSKKINDVVKAKRGKIGTHEFTEWVRLNTQNNNPANAKFFYAHQTSTHPPSFVFQVNDPKKIHFSLERNISNSIRKRWGYEGAPIRLKFIPRSKTTR